MFVYVEIFWEWMVFFDLIIVIDICFVFFIVMFWIIVWEVVRFMKEWCIIVVCVMEVNVGIFVVSGVSGGNVVFKIVGIFISKDIVLRVIVVGLDVLRCLVVRVMIFYFDIVFFIMVV